jgi:hypothetical protein
MTAKRSPSPPAGPQVSEPSTDLAALPPLVALMRRRILQACSKRDIEALRAPIDANEVRPLFEFGARRRPGEDPIERLKAMSFDGKGDEILSILSAVLHQPWVLTVSGPTRMYVWPFFAEKPLANPTPDERQAMLSCVRFADLGKSGADGRPLVMKVGIGADGVWHWFWTGAPGPQ